MSCIESVLFITRSDNWRQLDEGQKPTINIVLVFMCFIFVLAAYCIVIHGAVISDSDLYRSVVSLKPHQNMAKVVPLPSLLITGSSQEQIRA